MLANKLNKAMNCESSFKKWQIQIQKWPKQIQLQKWPIQIQKWQIQIQKWPIHANWGKRAKAKRFAAIGSICPGQ